jgi:hypothetical protein
MQTFSLITTLTWLKNIKLHLYKFVHVSEQHFSTAGAGCKPSLDKSEFQHDENARGPESPRSFHQSHRLS